MEHQRYLLGIDVGTLGVKGVLVGEDGRPMARAEISHTPRYPRPGWVEMDAERDWWGDAVSTIRELLAGASIPPADIAGVGVCGLVPCLCPVDVAGRPLGPAILYSDNRALEELTWVNETLGLQLTAQAVTPKILWLKKHQAGLFSQIDRVLSTHHFVVMRLTGRAVMDYDTASIMGGIFDARRRAWDEEACVRLGIPPHILPGLSPATAIVGGITPDAAQATGLAVGTPVIAGSGDTFPTMVGCGAIDPGDAMIAFGTTGLLTIAVQPLAQSAAGPHFSDAEGAASVLWGANVLSAGRLVRWFQENFAPVESMAAEGQGISPFVLLDNEADEIPAGSEGVLVLPHLLGRRTPTPDAAMRGTILGLDPFHTRAHVYRAVLESFAYNVRQSYEELRPHVQRVVATAGGARSPLWRQIMADVLDAPLEYHPHASGALGIAFLAGHGIGRLPDFGVIKREWLRDRQMTSPRPAAHAAYNAYFPLYCAFDTMLHEPYAHLSEITRRAAPRPEARERKRGKEAHAQP